MKYTRDQIESTADYAEDTTAMAEMIRQLLAENDALREDAERYRWLRENWFTMSATYMNSGVQFYTGGARYSDADESLLDETIDAARKPV